MAKGKSKLTVTTTFDVDDLAKFGELITKKTLAKSGSKVLIKFNQNVPVDSGDLRDSGSASTNNMMIATTGRYSRPFTSKANELFLVWSRDYAIYNQDWLISHVRNDKSWLNKTLGYYMGREIVNNIKELIQPRTKI